jgi:hypothetical protein
MRFMYAANTPQPPSLHTRTHAHTPTYFKQFHVLYFITVRWGEATALWNWVSDRPFAHPPPEYEATKEWYWRDRKLFRCHSERHKPQMAWPGRESGPPWRGAGDQPPLSYRTANVITYLERCLQQLFLPVDLINIRPAAYCPTLRVSLVYVS